MQLGSHLQRGDYTHYRKVNKTFELSDKYPILFNIVLFTKMYNSFEICSNVIDSYMQAFAS